jgi:hypothetical protein
VQDLAEIAEKISSSAARLVGAAGPDINLKLEAERLSGSANRLLEVAKRVAQAAAEDPRTASQREVQAESILSIAEDISSSAARLVGR